MARINFLIIFALFVFASISHSATTDPIYTDETYVVLKTERQLLIMRSWPLNWFAFPFTTEVNSFHRETAKDGDRSGTHFVINDEPVFFSEFKALLYYQSSRHVILGARIRDFGLQVSPGDDGVSETWRVIDQGNKTVVEHYFASENLKYVFNLHVPALAEQGTPPDGANSAGSR